MTLYIAMENVTIMGSNIAPKYKPNLILTFKTKITDILSIICYLCCNFLLFLDCWDLLWRNIFVAAQQKQNAQFYVEARVKSACCMNSFLFCVGARAVQIKIEIHCSEIRPLRMKRIICHFTEIPYREQSNFEFSCYHSEIGNVWAGEWCNFV